MSNFLFYENSFKFSPIENFFNGSKNPFKKNEDMFKNENLENSGCFLMTSLSVASTAAMVSSDVV